MQKRLEYYKNLRESENIEMVKGTITVNNKSGLHLRPASELSKIAGKLQSEITIVKGNMRVNPKKCPDADECRDCKGNDD